MGFEVERERMVERQIASRGITDEKVLGAMRKVPRHEFIPADLLDEAYADHPLPIGSGQTISQPYMVALMTECLGLRGDETVLEIGTGSGYQLAVLLEIAREAFSVERVPELAEQAQRTLNVLGYANFEIRSGDGTLGWEEHGPYDGIIVTAAAPRIPPGLLDQLKDPGRLVIPVGNSFSQILTIVEKRNGRVSVEEVCGCVFVPLIGKEGWRG